MEGPQLSLLTAGDPLAADNDDSPDIARTAAPDRQSQHERCRNAGHVAEQRSGEATPSSGITSTSAPRQEQQGGRRQQRKQRDSYGVTKFELQRCMTTMDGYVERMRQLDAASAALKVQIAREDLPGPSKQHLRCQHLMTWGRALFQCPHCWLLPFYCVCSQLQQFNACTKVVLQVHHNEWRTGSNTGCITHLSLPNSQLLLSSHPPHDEQLQELLQDPTYTTAVLWPGQAAITPQQLQQIAQQHSEGRIAVVALDATWDNAKRLERKFPEDTLQLTLPPDLALTHGGQASLFRPLRKHALDAASTGRVCTLEAVAAALWALEPDATRQQLYDGLLQNLRIKVDAMRRQKGLETVYGVS